MSSVPKWLQNRLLNIVANVSISVSNLVFKYQHADVLCSVGVESFKYLSASPDTWTPGFQQPEGPRKLINKVCDIKGFTITLDRKKQTFEVRDSSSLCVSPLGTVLRATRCCVCVSLFRSLCCIEVGSVRGRACVWSPLRH
jgi:hypothetical protein